MRHFSKAIALVLLALSTAACDPGQAIRDALPIGCNPPGTVPFAQPHTTLPGESAKSITSQKMSTRPGNPGPSISNVPDVNIPAELPNTKF